MVDIAGQQPSRSFLTQTDKENQARVDLELAAAVIGKDRKATAEFVSLYADAIYIYVRRRLIPRMDFVEDIVQEVFVAALDNLKQFRGTSLLRVWLLGIAKHKVDDFYRKRFREPDSVGTQESEVVLASDAPTVEESLDRAALEKRVSEILRELPEIYSLALMWRYWDRRSTKEIAEMTGKTEKAIERTLARARAEFKRKWNHE